MVFQLLDQALTLQRYNILRHYVLLAAEIVRNLVFTYFHKYYIIAHTIILVATQPCIVQSCSDRYCRHCFKIDLSRVSVMSWMLFALNNRLWVRPFCPRPLTLECFFVAHVNITITDAKVVVYTYQYAHTNFLHNIFLNNVNHLHFLFRSMLFIRKDCWPT